MARACDLILLASDREHWQMSGAAKKEEKKLEKHFSLQLCTPPSSPDCRTASLHGIIFNIYVHTFCFARVAL
jgi:hypothetical protein